MKTYFIYSLQLLLPTIFHHIQLQRGLYFVTNMIYWFKYDLKSFNMRAEFFYSFSVRRIKKYIIAVKEIELGLES